MQRLIDANKLIAKWKPVVKRYEGDSKYWETAYILEGVIEDVENEPTVDVVPKADYDHLLKRFKHLIQSDYIKGFDAWDSRKNDYVLDIRDAEPVVRCKDCRKWCICHKSDDFYCADGERREDE